MWYSLKQTTAPATEPVTLGEAKAHLRVDGDDDNAYISGLISAARQMAEAYTQRQLITATYTMKLHDFPVGENPICLPRTPLGSVTSITYIDADDVTTTLSTDVYEVLDNDTTAYIALEPGQIWPSARFEQYEAVTITFTAGYGAATSDVPATVRSAMYLIIWQLYDNRSAVVVGTIASEIPLGARTLLDTVKAKDVV